MAAPSSVVSVTPQDLKAKFETLKTSAKHEVIEWLFQDDEMVRRAQRYRRGPEAEFLKKEEMSRLFDMGFNVRVWQNAAGCIVCSREFYPFEGSVSHVTQSCTAFFRRFD